MSYTLNLGLILIILINMLVCKCFKLLKHFRIGAATQLQWLQSNPLGQLQLLVESTKSAFWWGKGSCYSCCLF